MAKHLVADFFGLAGTEWQTDQRRAKRTVSLVGVSGGASRAFHDGLSGKAVVDQVLVDRIPVLQNRAVGVEWHRAGNDVNTDLESGNWRAERLGHQEARSVVVFKEPGAAWFEGTGGMWTLGKAENQ